MDGVLLVHANPSLPFTTDTADYCGSAGLSDCGEATTSVPANPEVTTVFYVLAAFPPGSEPDLAGANFGVSYNDVACILVAHGNCADFELAGDGWPAPGTGVALTWSTGQTNLIVECYWFAGYAYDGPTTFELTPHPVQGGKFADNGVPAQLDEVTSYGSLGFGAAGSADCPGSGGLGDGGPDSPQDGGSEEPTGEEGAVPTGAQDTADDGVIDGVSIDDLTATVLVELKTTESAPGADYALWKSINQAVADSSLLNLFEQVGASEVRASYPGETFKPENCTDNNGKQVALLPLDRQVALSFKSNKDAAQALPILRVHPGIRLASPLVKMHTSTLPDDRFTNHWTPYCEVTQAADCRTDPQIHLYNSGTRALGPTAPSTCRAPVAGIDLGVTRLWNWPLAYPPVRIAIWDTGVIGSHEDLNIVPMTSAERQEFTNHPNNEYCGGKRSTYGVRPTLDRVARPRSISDRIGAPAKCSFHSRGVSSATRAAGWVSIRCNTSTK